MTRYYFHIIESLYQGLYGIEEYHIETFPNDDQAWNFCKEQEEYLIDSYSCCYEEESYDDEDFEYKYASYFYPIKEEYSHMSDEELLDIIYNEGDSYFETEYCEL